MGGRAKGERRAGGPGGLPRGSGSELTHVDATGRVRMVDVSGKGVTPRKATACGRIVMSQQALALVRGGQVAKGDPLQTARVAGIMAAKRTADLIPLCHSLPICHVEVELVPFARGYDIVATARTTAQTGVEMEALTAVAVAALTIYDMLKAVDREMVIGEIRLMSKRGGRTGAWTRP
jgi:cyclic pyranopterin phosphate synthase